MTRTQKILTILFLVFTGLVSWYFIYSSQNLASRISIEENPWKFKLGWGTNKQMLVDYIEKWSVIDNKESEFNEPDVSALFTITHPRPMVVRDNGHDVARQFTPAGRDNNGVAGDLFAYDLWWRVELYLDTNDESNISNYGVDVFQVSE